MAERTLPTTTTKAAMPAQIPFVARDEESPKHTEQANAKNTLMTILFFLIGG